ncbi:hypothetical protein D9M72_399050 [compost metagenome]
MVGANQAVAVRQRREAPVTPAADGADGLSLVAELRGACDQPVCLAERMLCFTMTTQVNGIGHSLQQAAAPQQPATAVAAGMRKDHLSVRGTQDRLEVPAICLRKRQRVQLNPGNDVIRQKAVFGDASWPTGGIQAQEAHMRPRRCREVLRGHPHDAFACFQSVIFAHRLQVKVQGCRRPGSKRLAPDAQCAPTKHCVARSNCAFMPLLEKLYDGTQLACVVVAVGPKGRVQAVDELVPGPRGGQRCVCGKNLLPALRQLRESAACRACECGQAPKALLGNPSQENVRQCRGCLTIPARRHLGSMREVQVEIGVVTQC